MNLTLENELIWVVFPLFLSTIVMLFYFEKYYDEKPGWNTHVANSLVLLFVSMFLLKHLYNLEDLGLINFIVHLDKFIFSIILLCLGIIILLLNFNHFLPEKIARHVSSPLNLNLFAYIAILYVYAGTKGKAIVQFSPNIEEPFLFLISLLIYFVLLIIILNLIRIPIKKFFNYIQKMKDNEEKEVILSDKKEINKKKKEVEQKEKYIKNAKKKLTKAEKEAKIKKLKELEKEKKKANQLKKVISSSNKKRRNKNKR